MNVKLTALVLLGLVLGICLGLVIADLYVVNTNAKYQIPSSVDDVLSDFKVQVVDTGTQFTFTLKDPLTRVIFWQQSGLMLSLEKWRVNVDWQITVGQEDAPLNGQGDSTDIILKLYKYTDSGKVGYDVACLGGYNKKVWYRDTLLLDTSTGQRRAADYLP